MNAPSGTVTFVFTDMEGSTGLWETAPGPCRAAMARHDAIVRQAVEAPAATCSPPAATAWPRRSPEPATPSPPRPPPKPPSATRTLARDAPCGCASASTPARSKNATATTSAPPVNRAARVMTAGHGGQILVSGTTAALLAGAELAQLIDLGEHRLRDLVAPEHLWQLGAGTFPPPRSQSRFRTNIVPPATSFIGREVEMAEVRCLLADHRLVTLTGAGGAGKTRLALQVAADDRSRFPDGAWMVELGALRDPAAIPAELAAALDVVAAPGQSLIGRAVEFLSDRHGLVILDNCEHLLDDTAQVVGGLLRACPHLAVLATSRESLSVPGEQAYGVRSLDLAASPGRRSAAARLFEERARADRADLRLDDAEGAVVERICARLDGMPLAIELAAARARSMGVVEIAARLDERFRLLGGAARGRVERHRTLRATVEWSYGLLSAAERDLFDRLSVFASTFDLHAAVAVGGAGDIDEFDVLDHLDSLVAKSMVGVEIHPLLGTRYRLLETLRAFGQERLDAADAIDAVRSEHADHYRTRALSSTRDFWGPDAGRVAARVLADAPEYRAAVGWLASTGRLDDALAISATHLWVAAQWDWWEPYEWLRELLADPAAAGCRHRSAATAALAASTLWHDADPLEAERLATEALVLRADPGQAPDGHAVEFTMSFLAMIQGHLELAVEWSRRWIEAGRTDGDPNVHSAMFMAAAALAQLGRTQEAHVLVGELERYYQAHPWAGAGYVINHTLGFITMETDPDLARQHFEEASRVGRAAGCPFWTRNATVEAMSLLVAHGPIREAAVGAGEVIGSLWEGRDMGNVTRAVSQCIVVCVRAGHHEEGARIDGWLAERGRSLVPGDLARYQRARAEIETHLGQGTVPLRDQGAEWSTPTAIEHILATMQAISDTATAEP